MEKPVRVRHDLSSTPGSGAALWPRLRPAPVILPPIRANLTAGANSEPDKTWGSSSIPACYSGCPFVAPIIVHCLPLLFFSLVHEGPREIQMGGSKRLG